MEKEMSSDNYLEVIKLCFDILFCVPSELSKLV